MNIAILISSLRFGGAEKQAVIDAGLLSKDHRVIFIVFEKGQLADQVPLSVQLIVLKKGNYFSTAIRLAGVLRQHKINIVHAHLFAPMLISALATILCRTRSVWNFHSHAYEGNWQVRLWHSFASHLPGVRRIIFPAQELMNYYRAKGYHFPKSKEMVLFNSGQLELKPHKLNEANGEVHIGFIGRLIPLKRVGLLIEAARQLRSRCKRKIRISIVGDGEQIEQLKEQARQVGVSDIVNFWGFQKDTASFYRTFDLFALPSEEEVLSLSLIDAQLFGVPSIAFSVGGNSDIIDHGKSGYLAESEDEFKDYLAGLSNDADLRKTFGLHAARAGREKFSPQSRLKKLSALYRLVLHQEK